MRVRDAKGTVKSWNAEEGWGILISPDAPGEVWAHFSAIEGTGFRELHDGEPVTFRYRRGIQDGYSYVAVSVRRS